MCFYFLVMRLIEIIESLNNSIKDTVPGHLVLHNSITPKTIKAYKTVEYNLWYILPNTKELILSIQYTEKILEGEKETVMNTLDKKFITELFTALRCSKKFNFIRQHETT